MIAGKESVVLYFYNGRPAVTWSFVTGGTAIGDDICHAVLVKGTTVYAAGEVHDAGSGQDAGLFKLSAF